MPFYDYYCEKNGQTIEVFHAMSLRLTLWGEVCKHAQVELGSTPPQEPVIRLSHQISPTIFRVKGLDKDEPSKILRV